MLSKLMDRDTNVVFVENRKCYCLFCAVLNIWQRQIPVHSFMHEPHPVFENADCGKNCVAYT